MEKIREIKEKLIDCVYDEIENNMDKANTKEIGEIIDMIKDLTKVMYDCKIIEAMEEHPEQIAAYMAKTN